MQRKHIDRYPGLVRNLSYFVSRSILIENRHHQLGPKGSGFARLNSSTARKRRSKDGRGESGRNTHGWR